MHHQRYHSLLFLSTCVLTVTITARAADPEPCINAQDHAAPSPIVAWPADPLEVHVAFDRPLDPASVAGLVGQSITFNALVSAGDRLKTSKPPDKTNEAHQAAARGTLKIAAARLDDDNRTLVLSTDPHPWDATYALSLQGLRGAQAKTTNAAQELNYDLTGVEVLWEPDDANDTPEPFWWPHLDPDAVRRLTGGSVPHSRSLAALARPGRLSLRTIVRLPPDDTTLAFEAGGTLAIEEFSLDGEPGEMADEGRRATIRANGEGEPAELILLIKTQPGAHDARPTLYATHRSGDDPAQHPLRPDQLRLPWAPAPPPVPSGPPPIPAALAGGDPARGETVFLGQDAKCASCHQFRSRGEKLGPDLSNLHERDIATVYRDIAEPSATINPDYVPYTIVLKDGRVLAGVVRGEADGTLRVIDTNAQQTRVARAEIEELRPTATSIMPVGLAGVLGEARMRDLLAYLTRAPENQ